MTCFLPASTTAKVRFFGCGRQDIVYLPPTHYHIPVNKTRRRQDTQTVSSKLSHKSKNNAHGQNTENKTASESSAHDSTTDDVSLELSRHFPEIFRFSSAFFQIKCIICCNFSMKSSTYLFNLHSNILTHKYRNIIKNHIKKAHNAGPVTFCFTCCVTKQNGKNA